MKQFIKDNLQTKESKISNLLEGMLSFDTDKRLTLVQCLDLLETTFKTPKEYVKNLEFQLHKNLDLFQKENMV